MQEIIVKLVCIREEIYMRIRNFSSTLKFAKANFEEAKAMGKPETRKTMMQAERDEQIAEAKKRQEEAQARMDAAQKSK